MSQNYSNHRRFVPAFHFVTLPVLLFCLIGSVVNLANSFSDHSNLYSASLIVVMNLAMIMIAFFARSFALKAQDRAIRAEENLRHFVLTGKLTDPRLTTGQIIALRFADDASFVNLAQVAVAEDLKPNDIKKRISNWKADYHRV